MKMLVPADWTLGWHTGITSASYSLLVHQSLAMLKGEEGFTIWSLRRKGNGHSEAEGDHIIFYSDENYFTDAFLVNLCLLLEAFVYLWNLGSYVVLTSKAALFFPLSNYGVSFSPPLKLCIAFRKSEVWLWHYSKLRFDGAKEGISDFPVLTPHLLVLTPRFCLFQILIMEKENFKDWNYIWGCIVCVEISQASASCVFHFTIH